MCCAIKIKSQTLHWECAMLISSIFCSEMLKHSSAATSPSTMRLDNLLEKDMRICDCDSPLACSVNLSYQKINEKN